MKHTIIFLTLALMMSGLSACSLNPPIVENHQEEMLLNERSFDGQSVDIFVAPVEWNAISTLSDHPSGGYDPHHAAAYGRSMTASIETSLLNSGQYRVLTSEEGTTSGVMILVRITDWGSKQNPSTQGLTIGIAGLELNLSGEDEEIRMSADVKIIDLLSREYVAMDTVTSTHKKTSHGIDISMSGSDIVLGGGKASSHSTAYSSMAMKALSHDIMIAVTKSIPNQYIGKG